MKNNEQKRERKLLNKKIVRIGCGFLVLQQQHFFMQPGCINPPKFLMNHLAIPDVSIEI